MRDIVLEHDSNNFLWERGSITISTTFLQYMEQKIRAALSIFKGEWYLDTSLGIPYIADFDTDKTTHRAILESAIRAKVVSLDGVEKVLSFSASLNKQTRMLQVAFVAKLTNGETLEINNAVVGGGE